MEWFFKRKILQRNLKLHLKKLEEKLSGQKILVKFSEWKGIKKMVLPDFVLTNSFSNNFLLM